MKIPYKPTKPKPPQKEHTCDTLEYPLPRGETKVLSIEPLIKYCISRYHNACYKSLRSEGEWKLFAIKSYYDELYLIFKGGILLWENRDYERELKKYEKLMEEYPKKLEKYEIDYKNYLGWKQERERKSKDKARLLLEKQISLLNKQLKKLDK